MQTIAVLSALRDAGLQTRIPDIFLGITEPATSGKANGLRDLLGQYHVPMLNHDAGVGGRYSVLTNVGLLPAAMLGLDVAAVRAGAGLALAPVLAKKPAAQVPAAVSAALSVALAEDKRKSISVMMAYNDSRIGMCSSGRKAWAKTARAPRPLRRSGRSISIASCNCSSPGRATSSSRLSPLMAQSVGRE